MIHQSIHLESRLVLRSFRSESLIVFAPFSQISERPAPQPISQSAMNQLDG
jgi:hypothetical protein